MLNDIRYYVIFSLFICFFFALKLDFQMSPFHTEALSEVIRLKRLITCVECIISWSLYWDIMTHFKKTCPNLWHVDLV